MRLIDADALLNHLYNKQQERVDVALEIARFPTVDAVEVVHGKMDSDKVWDVIHELSDIRAQYSCFDADEVESYRACSFAIEMLRDIVGERRSGE